MRDEGGTDENSAMMSSISEAWEIMTKQMHMRYDDVGKVFEKWTSSGELVSLRSLQLNTTYLTRLLAQHVLGQNRRRDLRDQR